MTLTRNHIVEASPINMNISRGGICFLSSHSAILRNCPFHRDLPSSQDNFIITKAFVSVCQINKKMFFQALQLPVRADGLNLQDFLHVLL
jgi:hypothetical protein